MIVTKVLTAHWLHCTLQGGQRMIRCTLQTCTLSLQTASKLQMTDDKPGRTRATASAVSIMPQNAWSTQAAGALEHAASFVSAWVSLKGHLGQTESNVAPLSRSLSDLEALCQLAGEAV